MSDSAQGAAYLDVHAVVRRAGFALDVTLKAPQGQIIALLGPNGAGKTTLLGTIAGTVPLAGGHLTVDGVSWTGPGGTRPPHHRAVGLLAADHLLFPHLDAAHNVAFGPRARGVRRRQALARAREELTLLGIGDLAERRPRQLSHGQAQRVALARALATEPQLLLLDEPLSDLDPQVRPAIRADLAARLRGFDGVTLLVTHDPLDALTLADELVFLRAGRIVQQGSPRSIVEHPRDAYVAQVAGLNLYPGEVIDDEAIRLDGGLPLVTSGQDHRGRSWAAFPPSAVALHRTRPEGSARNVWSVGVDAVEVLGQTARVQLGGPIDIVADITVGSLATLRLAPGEQVWASVKATEVRSYPA